MTNRKLPLSKQFIILILLIFLVTFVLLGVFLPKKLLPVYESTIYSYLKQPLDLVKSDINDNIINTEVGYLYIINKSVSISDNLYDIIEIDNVDDILSKITDIYGKFSYNSKTYYYYTSHTDDIIKIALTNDKYINQNRNNLMDAIFPVLLITFLFITLLLSIWSNVIVRKIERLKLKIDNIDNENFNHKIDFKTDDEIKSLALAIEDMRVSLKNQEEFKNQTYQNISHDFKTPLTVIKSYIEAIEDAQIDKDKALNVIKEQTDKLNNKVYSLLYLNKLDYINTLKDIELKEVKIDKIIDNSVNKFKYQNKDLSFTVRVEKNAKFYGTEDLWETIIDNMFSNFIRYAKKEIRVTVKRNQIILYNDGEKINDDLVDSIFIPFRKGMKGEFGLGLSIVKKSLTLMGYDITIKNSQKKGVSFIIKRD